ncbi:family transcriptional regulator [Bacillus safensis FO-36b] [Bacillus safensis subsp. safensis]
MIPLKETQESVMNYLQFASLPKGYEVTKKEVLAPSRHLQTLCLFISFTNALSRIALLVLDKGANALAQQTLRELYTEELKKTKENEWLQKWFQEEHIKKEMF